MACVRPSTRHYGRRRDLVAGGTQSQMGLGRRWDSVADADSVGDVDSDEDVDTASYRIVTDD